MDMLHAKQASFPTCSVMHTDYETETKLGEISEQRKLSHDMDDPKVMSAARTSSKTLPLKERTNKSYHSLKLAFPPTTTECRIHRI